MKTIKKIIKFFGPVYWFNELLTLIVKANYQGGNEKPRTILGKYFAKWRWVRRLEGGHYEKWLVLSPVNQYIWLRVESCYHQTGHKPFDFAHVTVVCEDYISNKNQTQIQNQKA